MAKSKRVPKAVLKLPDLEQSKSAVSIHRLVLFGARFEKDLCAIVSPGGR